MNTRLSKNGGVAAAAALLLASAAALPGRALAQSAPAAGAPAGAPQAPPPGDPLGPDVFLAIGRGDAAALKAALAKGAKLEGKNWLGITPLIWAAGVGNEEACRILLDAGADVHAADRFGSALNFAEMGGNQEVVRLLVERGAKMDAERADGITPVMTAAEAGHLDALRLLLSRFPGQADKADAEETTPLIYAARRGQAAALRVLLGAGARVDAADMAGRTALMHAAQNGYAECAALLLKHGASVNAKDRGGNTALLLAARYTSETPIVRTLLEAGADASIRDAKGRTALDLAIAHGSPAAIALKRGAMKKPAASGAAADPLPAAARTAVEKALPLIERSNKTFSERVPCASCHHQGVGLLATGVAAERGFRIDRALASAQTKLVLDGDQAQAGGVAQIVGHPEMYKHVPGVDLDELSPVLSTVYSGLLAHGEKGGALQSQIAVILAAQQAPEGYWGFKIHREPMQSSRFQTTAQSVRVLQALMPADRSEETARRVAAAREWLKRTKATTNEDRTFRLLGLKWTGADAASIAKTAAELKAAQRPDGGWAQFSAPATGGPAAHGSGDGAYLRSDAYATGQALYALAVGGGVATDSEAYRRGVRFLLRTQDDDGSWLVTKRAIPLNTYFDAGFPHGQSQYSSYAATCWATMALALAAEPARPAAPLAASGTKVSRR